MFQGFKEVVVKYMQFCLNGRRKELERKYTYETLVGYREKEISVLVRVLAEKRWQAIEEWNGISFGLAY